ncbi:hypothetical protein [Mycolicibacterium parafortuitum]|nr:hypothetical protein [Mycolicibacterium parafortuitum]
MMNQVSEPAEALALFGGIGIAHGIGGRLAEASKRVLAIGVPTLLPLGIIVVGSA